MFLGTVDRSLDSNSIITSSQVQWFVYQFLGDVLSRESGAYLRDFGSLGQPHQLTVDGLGWQSISVLMDGRPMNEPLSGMYNLSLFSTEYMTHAEVITGVRSFLYGLNSTGETINLVTQEFYTNHPYSRIRYMQGVFDLLSTDGIFSQNILSGLNFTGAFQRQTLEGRFPNSKYDAWNVRAKLRYLLSNRFNLTVSELYNRTTVGLNGGIDPFRTPPQNVFNEISALIRSPSASEEITRHDVNITAGARLFDDSSAISSATLFYSHNLREYHDEAKSSGIAIQSNHQTAWYGVSLKQNYTTKAEALSLSADVQTRKVLESFNVPTLTETITSLYGKNEIKISPVLNLAVMGRYDHLRSDNLFSYGADATVRLLPRLSLIGGYSRSYRTSTIEELYWIDSTITRKSSLRPERHKLAEVGLLFTLDFLSLKGTFFERQINNAIVEEPSNLTALYPNIVLNIDQEILRGIKGRIEINLWKFSTDGTITYLTQKLNGVEKKIYPKFFLQGGLYFRGKIFDGNLDLKIGFKGKYFTEQVGEEYTPLTMLYTESRLNIFGPSGSVDFVVVGKVGDAYIHFLWENLTDEHYYLTPVYPMQNRSVRLGVAWEFLD